MSKSKQILKNARKGIIAPSILSADFANLGRDVKAVQRGGAGWIHVDVMDGRYVPNLTIGPLVAKAIRPVTKLPLDCHLMVARPQDWITAFADAGADIITIHAEATMHLDRQLNKIKERGCLAGVSLNPATPLNMIEEVMDLVDLVLIMSVNPGFGGQSFIPGAVNKIERLAGARGDRPFVIEVDGGVGVKNIGRLRRAGVDVFVAGSSVYGGDAVANVRKLRAAMTPKTKK